MFTIARLTPDYSPSDDLIKCLLCAYVPRIIDELCPQGRTNYVWFTLSLQIGLPNYNLG